MKLLRTIRLDPSDTFVFACAAEAGEWAISGSFMFMDADIDAMGPKERAAFRSGFLGVQSFGWSTLAIVSVVGDAEREEALTSLATALMRDCGAPDITTARAAAAEEIAFAASLCDHPENTLVALHRTLDGGELKERFRTLTPRAEALGPDAPKTGFRAFDFFETDGQDDDTLDGGGTVDERIDLASLIKPEPMEGSRS